ncbi:XRE family transcriptional regulator [Rothia nasimurium]|uniref:XRE family transcriptional regulator n=1 Tax=Rothia nasimurium TaxID=85336 RepID=A0A4Y9F105_9MICC|nr:helix-turn-helix transcriptional regulator [Rothia nasimurium]MBF0809367.1 helix-turn-helix transcriptional regulator [Rothia nasimurium]TFU19675.1 XRE family transcriptional regulator [Rothia nasimurium]
MHIPRFTLKDRIIKARTDAGLKQHELASIVGVSANSMTRYEKEQRTPPPEIVEAIAEATGVPLEWFYQEDNSEPASHPALPERIILIRDGNGYKAEL